jgi:hypothetical protein
VRSLFGRLHNAGWRDEISLLCSRLKTSGVRFGDAVISRVGEQKVQGLKDHVVVEDWIFFIFIIHLCWKACLLFGSFLFLHFLYQNDYDC